MSRAKPSREHCVCKREGCPPPPPPPSPPPTPRSFFFQAATHFKPCILVPTHDASMVLSKRDASIVFVTEGGLIFYDTHYASGVFANGGRGLSVVLSHYANMVFANGSAFLFRVRAMCLRMGACKWGGGAWTDSPNSTPNA